METATKYQPRVVRGRVELWVPHNRGEVAFAHPIAGPETYRNVGAKILEANQGLPTGDYTASLLHAAYCSQAKDEPEFENVRNGMRNRWLWVFDRVGWTNKGVYVLQDLEAIGRSQPLDITKLEKRLKGGKELSWGGIRISKDGMVRFAPKESYVLGERTPEQLAKDGLMVATYNVEGAEKCAEASKTKRCNPITYGVDVSGEGIVEQRVSAVGVDVDRLLFDGYGSDGDYYGGVASGVLK